MGGRVGDGNERSSSVEISGMGRGGRLDSRTR